MQVQGDLVQWDMVHNGSRWGRRDKSNLMPKATWRSLGFIPNEMGTHCRVLSRGVTWDLYSKTGLCWVRTMDCSGARKESGRPLRLLHFIKEIMGFWFKVVLRKVKREWWGEMRNFRTYFDIEPTGLSYEKELGSRGKVGGIKTLVWACGIIY